MLLHHFGRLLADPLYDALFAGAVALWLYLTIVYARAR